MPLGHRLKAAWEAFWTPETPTVRALARRVEALEVDFEHHGDLIRRVSSRINGGIRAPKPETVDSGAPDADGLTEEQINQAIKEGRFNSGILRNHR